MKLHKKKAANSLSEKKINHKEKTRTDKKTKDVSSFTLIKYFLLLFLLVTLPYAVIDYVTDKDMSSALDFARQAGSCIFSNSLLLLGVELLDWLEQTSWNKKVQLGLFRDETYKLLRCSRAYFFFPVCTVLLDVMIFALLWQGAKEKGSFQQAVQLLFCREYLFALLFVLFFHAECIFVVLFYCCSKVCYTPHYIVIVHFLHKKVITCSQIQYIEHFYDQKKDCHMLILKTNYETFRFRSDFFCDGFKEFLVYLMNLSSLYHIPVTFCSRSF